MDLQKERITGFDTLRFLMVSLVIALHSAMTYMEYPVPWWYVVDDQKSIVFTFIVVFFDSFPMSVLFFLAGYFAYSSFNRKSPALFLKDKLLRLGIPWILGVVLVAPLLARSSMIALGYPPPDIPVFIMQYFLGPFYQQGPYWFLGILFFFMILYAVMAAIGKKTGIGKKRNKKPEAKPWVVLAALWAVSVLTYYISGRYIKPAVDWLNAGYILYFQPSRIAGYFLMFMAGLYGRRMSWFTGNGWSPNVLVWGIVSVVSSIFLLGFRFFIAPFCSELFGLVSEAFTYNTIVLSKTLFLLAFFSGSHKFLCSFAKYFKADTFGIYWLHMIILMPMLYFLKLSGLPAALKWMFSIPATIVIGSLVLRCGRRIRKLFS